MSDQSDKVATIYSLLDRLSRMISSEGWDADLNPAQKAALSYLGRANRFSRSPSVVAEYLGATRGTISQTLKALLRKGLIEESPNPTDGRSISYKLTRTGQTLVGRRDQLHDVLAGLPAKDRNALEARLGHVVSTALKKRGLRTFGVCKTCKYHRSNGTRAHCALLDLPLRAEETSQICIEQTTS